MALCEANRDVLDVPELREIRTQFIHEYARRPPKSWDEANVAGLAENIDDGDDVMDAIVGLSSSRRTTVTADAYTSATEHGQFMSIKRSFCTRWNPGATPHRKARQS